MPVCRGFDGASGKPRFEKMAFAGAVKKGFRVVVVWWLRDLREVIVVSVTLCVVMCNDCVTRYASKAVLRIVLHFA